MCLLLCLTNDYGGEWFDDSGFLSRYFGESVTQEMNMVEGDIGDYAELRFYYVGAVEASSHSDFNDRHIDFLFSEIIESHSGCHLKK